ncbi:MAG: hypothetical protein O2901_04560 [Verrucomicrobia bacterium]|nr:hypothetical protein [Verrucomicrobiota bacterium]
MDKVTSFVASFVASFVDSGALKFPDLGKTVSGQNTQRERRGYYSPLLRRVGYGGHGATIEGRGVHPALPQIDKARDEACDKGASETEFA